MRRSASFALTMLALFVAAPSDGQARERVVRCRVESAGKVEIDGKCLFGAEKDGSFNLADVGSEKPLYGEILSVSVTMVGPDLAEVRGLTRDGVNSRWGEAHRSVGDRACWDGSDFRICAY